MTDPAPDGVVVVDKPAGMTSHDVVDRVRRLAGTRKVGHAGTLDPMATGVLLLGAGRATRLLGHLALTEKTYDATIRLGAATTTDDAEGEVVSRVDASSVDEARVRAELAGFVGDVEQVPASVSAVKVGGRPAHARMRAGEEVVLAPRRVRIHSLEVSDVRRTGACLDVDVTVHCSSGTYVRSIARDLGQRLAVGGHLVALRRTAAGWFTLDAARTLEQLEQRFAIVPIDEVARECFPSLELSESLADAVRHGRKLTTALPAPGPVALFGPDGRFLALYEQAGELARAVAVFT